MRRTFIVLFFLGLVLYVITHLILASSPVQQRVLKEVQGALKEYGIDFEMESVEFSGLLPKLYLNRVKINTRKGAPFQLPEPLSLDKIRISFLPVPLLYKKIVIDELVFFHPTVILPKADLLYAKAERFLKTYKKAELGKSTGGMSIELRKVSIIDASVDVTVTEPKMELRSHSLSASVDLGSNQQRGFALQSKDFKFFWDKMDLSLKEIDVDLDWSPYSLRVNKAHIQSPDTDVDVKGAMSLPLDPESFLPHSLKVSYEVHTDLDGMKRFNHPVLARFLGKVHSSGHVQLESGQWGGSGSLGYEKFSYRGYEIGAGNLDFILKKDLVEFTSLKSKFASGNFQGQKVALHLNSDFTFEGQLIYSNLNLENVLRAVKVTDPNVVMQMEGKASVTGKIRPDFELTANLEANYSQLAVLDNPKKAVSEENTLIHFGDGKISGPLKFTEHKMFFDNQVGILQGGAHLGGAFGFDEDSKITIDAKAVSITEMKKIGNLKLEGIADLKADIEIKGDDARVTGHFDGDKASIAEVPLGKVRGDAVYQGLLLTFENLEVPSIQPIRANGYVDFKPKQVFYKFFVEAPRASVSQLSHVFDNYPLSFQMPSIGESSIRAELGGGEGVNFYITASGQARDFEWYKEKWRAASFAVSYRDGDTQLRRVLLHKNAGGVELRGVFNKVENQFEVISHGLGIESLDLLKGSPVRAELVGRVQIKGDKKSFFKSAKGELHLQRTFFRDKALPESVVRISNGQQGIEMNWQVGGDALQGTYLLSEGDKPNVLDIHFKSYDFAPLITVWAQKDLSQLSSLKGTGSFNLKGNFYNWKKIIGKGKLDSFEVGFKGKPMQTDRPILFHLNDGSLKIEPVSLSGPDSQVALELEYIPLEKIQAKIDGKLDLQFLQPFIPGVEAGTGEVTLRVQASGHPSRFQMLGNLSIKDGVIRLIGLKDEFRSTQGQITVSHDKLAIEQLEASLNGGTVRMTGDVKIDRFNSFAPNLKIAAEKVSMNVEDYLKGRLSGNFTLAGLKRPYTFAGQCQLNEGYLTSFNIKSSSTSSSEEAPVLKWDIRCQAPGRLFVNTDIMEAEFHGDVHLVGDSNKMGLIGNLESSRGTLIFRDTRFAMDPSMVRFEDREQISPRFRVSGTAMVKELKSLNATNIHDLRDYQINIQVSGIPSNYKIRLTSTPALTEQEIISLLVLGVTQRGGDAGGAADLGSALSGQIPFQSKIKNELGVGVKIKNESQAAITPNQATAGTAAATQSVPTVEIQKELGRNTRLSYSNSLDTSIPVSEFKIQQMLDENFSVNASTRRSQQITTPQPSQAYGVDVRYRFQFE